MSGLKESLFGEALINKGLIDQKNLAEALHRLKEKRASGESRYRLGDALVDLGMLSREAVEFFVSELHGNSSKKIRHDIAAEPDEFISTSATDAPAVRYLNNLFRSAAREGISDVHLEDDANGCRIRVRVRGVMTAWDYVSTTFSRDFDAKIRSKCRLSLVDRNAPLDGKFRYVVDGRDVDVRVSILPLSEGKQSIVCRLLDSKSNLITLDEIVMPDDVRRAINHVISQPQGLFLVTGPTGSGKTTTLYGIMKQLNTPEVKILTAEDPIEYRLPGISQSEMNNKMTFASALKSMLRQDPDIILVGEIRDSETARIAVQASLTGHIVLSTLHTNSALTTLNRLLDLGVDPNALSSAIGGFMAQRLIRRLCPHCKTPREVTEYDRHQILASGCTEQNLACVSTLYEPHKGGCEHCSNGWVGRLPVIELVISSHDVRLAIEQGDLKALERAAKMQQQYRTLGHHAMLVALHGETSIMEAMAATGSTIVEIGE